MKNTLLVVIGSLLALLVLVAFLIWQGIEQRNAKLDVVQLAVVNCQTQVKDAKQEILAELTKLKPQINRSSGSPGAVGAADEPQPTLAAPYRNK